jgi:tryptophanyl-tRNA synthetase
VPVGEDQTQHLELACDTANRFNRIYGETFVLPKPMIDKDAARIMSLQNPEKKMSKSDSDPKGTINLLESVDDIAKKIKSAVTDSSSSLDGEKYRGEHKSDGVSNLLSIYSALQGISFAQAVKDNDGKKYGTFKSDVAEVVVNYISNIQTRYYSIRSDKEYLHSVLEAGKEHAISTSTKKIQKVRELMGLYK